MITGTVRRSSRVLTALASWSRCDHIPEITGVSFTSAGLQLTCNDVVGETYRVRCADSLNAATWTTVPAVMVAGSARMYWVDTDTFTTTGRFHIVELVDP